MIKTLGTCKWADIKVGEVFAVYGCWSICYKVNNDECIFLETDQTCLGDYMLSGNNRDLFSGYAWDELHKLPLSFQRNFIEWKGGEDENA